MSVPDRAGRVGPFVTFVDRVRPDGAAVARWESRRHRKHPQGAPAAGSTWWAPKARGWWIAVLFAVGSLLFALGAVPGYAQRGRDPLGRRDLLRRLTVLHLGWVFDLPGSRGCRPAERRAPPGGASSSSSPAGSTGGRARCNLPGPCTSTSAPGTRCGSTSTAQAANQHVWRPDAVGSICFLVASALAWFEVCHGWAAWRPRSWSWWITLANLIGSVAFGVSAVAGDINPATGQLHNAERSNLGTFDWRGVLLRRGAAAPARTHRGSQPRSDDTRRQRHLNPQPRGCG